MEDTIFLKMCKTAGLFASIICLFIYPIIIVYTIGGILLFMVLKILAEILVDIWIN